MSVKSDLLTASPRTIAIGDVHGCARALSALVAGLNIQPEDTVVLLGDAIDRGPDSRNVLEQLLVLGQRCQLIPILGNHEQMLLDAVDGKIPVQEWLQHGGADTLDSYGKNAGVSAVDPRHIEYMQSWGDVYESPGHFFVHGNYLASKPLTRQPWRDLRWQSLKWHTPGVHCSGKTAVVGHTSSKEGRIVNLGHIVCIDTYCCGGYWLTALDVTTGRVWQSNETGEFKNGELPPIQSTVAVRE